VALLCAAGWLSSAAAADAMATGAPVGRAPDVAAQATERGPSRGYDFDEADGILIEDILVSSEKAPRPPAGVGPNAVRGTPAEGTTAPGTHAPQTDPGATPRAAHPQPAVPNPAARSAGPRKP
jgi:hypothetical protein